MRRRRSTLRRVGSADADEPPTDVLVLAPPAGIPRVRARGRGSPSRDRGSPDHAAVRWKVRSEHVRLHGHDPRGASHLAVPLPQRGRRRHRHYPAPRRGLDLPPGPPLVASCRRFHPHVGGLGARADVPQVLVPSRPAPRGPGGRARLLVPLRPRDGRRGDRGRARARLLPARPAPTQVGVDRGRVRVPDGDVARLPARTLVLGRGRRRLARERDRPGCRRALDRGRHPRATPEGWIEPEPATDG